MTKPSQPRPTNISSSRSAISFGPPTIASAVWPRPENVMKSRVVGLVLPLVFSTPSRIPSMPCMPCNSSVVSGSSMPLPPKSKFSPSANSESASLVIEPLDLGRIGKTAALLVDDQGTVFPGIPMAEHDFHEFIGAVVAQVMFEVMVLAHVECFAVIHGRDHIPGGPAVGHQIQRRKTPRHVERLVIGGRAGRGEPELFGDHAHRGQYHDRGHLDAADAVFDGMRVALA